MSATLHSGCNSAAGDPVPTADLLVTIAGSAGAFEPMRRLLSDLPRDFRAAIVAMLHTGPGSVLAETLRRRSPLDIHAARSGELLRAGNVYVAAPGTHVIVNPDARLTVSSAPRRGLFRPSAEWLFDSAAASTERTSAHSAVAAFWTDFTSRHPQLVSPNGVRGIAAQQVEGSDSSPAIRLGVGEQMDQLSDTPAPEAEVVAVADIQAAAMRDADQVVVSRSPRVVVSVASLADVIRSKEASGREKDRAALPLLRRTLEELEGGP